MKQTSPSTRSRVAKFFDRFGGFATGILTRLRNRPSQRAERILFLVSLVLFVGAAAIAASNFPEIEGRINWVLVIAAGVVGMPLNLILNAVEFRITGSLIGHSIPFARALKVTIIGSALNLMPLPGSTLVRIQALAIDKARYRDAVTASVAVGVLSVGANLFLVGLTQWEAGSAMIPLGLTVIGLVIIASAIAVMYSTLSMRLNTRPAVGAVVVELLYASVSAVRLWVILIGLGLDIGLVAAFALTATGSLATAVGFFPAGLGIREALIGLVSPLVGVSTAVGLTGAVVTRLFGFLVLAIGALIVVVRNGSDQFRASEQSGTQANLPRADP